MREIMRRIAELKVFRLEFERGYWDPDTREAAIWWLDREIDEHSADLQSMLRAG